MSGNYYTEFPQKNILHLYRATLIICHSYSSDSRMLTMHNLLTLKYKHTTSEKLLDYNMAITWQSQYGIQTQPFCVSYCHCYFYSSKIVITCIILFLKSVHYVVAIIYMNYTIDNDEFNIIETSFIHNLMKQAKQE